MRSTRGRITVLGVAVALGLGVFWVLRDSSPHRAERRSAPDDSGVYDADPGRNEGRSAASPDPQDGGEVPRPPGDAARLVHGRVLHAGEPVAGARLHAAPPEFHSLSTGELARWCTPAWSGEDGDFSLALVQDRPFALICRKAGFLPRVLAFDSVPRTPVTIEMSAGETVTGRVVDRAGNAIAGARVHARAYAVSHAVASAEEASWPGPDAVHYAETVSDDSGRFSIPGLDPALVYLVEAWSAGYAMECTSLVTPQCHVRPPGDVGEIVLMRAFAAVFGVRRGEVDLTCTVSIGMYLGLARITPPEGFEVAFRGVPTDRFPEAIGRRLRELERERGVYLLRPTTPSIRIDPPPELAVEILKGRDVTARFQVPLRPVGATDWDRRQWYELPADGGTPPGKVEITAPGWGEAVMMESRETGVFFAFPDAEGRAVVHVPPGTYLIRRVAASLYGERCSVSVASEETARVGLPPPRGVLTIDPRSASGAPLREVGILIRRGRDILHRELDPLGCSDGALRLPIEGTMVGEVEIWLTKEQYREHRGTVTLGGEDIRWTPTLVPLRPQ